MRLRGDLLKRLSEEIAEGVRIGKLADEVAFSPQAQQPHDLHE
jgi:hypothetical protein